MAADFDHQILDPAQSRLLLRCDLIVTPHDNSTFIIEDPPAGKFYLVGKPEWLVISQFDGTCTIADAVGQAATQAPQGAALTEREGISVARWLVDQSLAKPVDALIARDDPGRLTSIGATFNPFMIRLGAFNPDEALVAIDAPLGWIWSKPFLALWITLGLAAAYKLSAHWSQWNAQPMQILDRDNWLRLGLVWGLLKLLHEFGHGLSCRHFGVPVRSAGLLLIFFAPVPFVDVSGSWRLPSRNRRIVISFAGMYLELLVAFTALLFWNPTSLSLFDRLCVDIVLLAGFNTLAFNANPLMRFDGYYILADMVRIPNLAVESRRYLSNAAKFWFQGLDVPEVAGTPLVRYSVKTYAYASSAWRCGTFFGIALSLIASWSWWGAAASIVVGWFWFGLKLPNRSRRQDAPTPSGKGYRRRKVTYAAVSAVAALLFVALFAPVNISAPAVVEYAPLTVIRAVADGFVTKVYIREGQNVAAGDLLLEITNDDVASKVKRLEVEIAQARLRSGAYLKHNELSKQQTESALADSLETQRREALGQLEGLHVCSARAATVASDVDGLIGRYVKKGDVLLLLGAENEKELLVSAASTDEKQFASHLGEAVSLFRPHSGRVAATGRLANVDPRVSETLQHQALGADTGGDVAVKLNARTSKQDLDDSPSHSLVPRLAAKVALDADTSLRFRAGQRMIVRLSGTYETWGSRMLKRWHEYLIEVAAGASAATGDAAQL